MHPTPNQQLAVEAILNTLTGQREFERLCAGIMVERPDQGVLYVFVSNENCAAEIETNYADELAVAAEQVFRQPITVVNVLPLDFTSNQRC